MFDDSSFKKTRIENRISDDAEGTDTWRKLVDDNTEVRLTTEKCYFRNTRCANEDGHAQ